MLLLILLITFLKQIGIVIYEIFDKDTESPSCRIDTDTESLLLEHKF